MRPRIGNTSRDMKMDFVSNYALTFTVVMPGLVPGIHDFPFCHQDVDGRA